jgi:hypothetical protein
LIFIFILKWFQIFCNLNKNSLICQTHFFLVVFFGNSWDINSLKLSRSFLAIISTFSFLKLCNIFIFYFLIFEVSFKNVLFTFIFIYVTFRWNLIIFKLNYISSSFTNWKLLLIAKICSYYFLIPVNLYVILFRVCATLFIKFANITCILKLILV